MTTDEGFREIQLNGKQLVFLFMAATVVSVVIFLCGVLVGRGVRPDRRRVRRYGVRGRSRPTWLRRPQQALGRPQQSPPAEPPAPADELSYFDRLQKNNTPEETLKSSSPVPNRRAAPAPRKAVALLRSAASTCRRLTHIRPHRPPVNPQARGLPSRWRRGRTVECADTFGEEP